MIILFQGSQKHSFKISDNAVVQKRFQIPLVRMFFWLDNMILLYLAWSASLTST